MADRLKGKVAIVTGGGSGIGKAVAQRFVEEGAYVSVVDRDKEKAAAAVKELGSNTIAVCADVSKFDDNKEAVKRTVEQFGKLDVFVGNAGVFDGFQTLDQSVEEMFDSLFAVNVKGYFLGAKASVEELRKTRGTMIFTASTAGFYTQGGGLLYTASKHAVVGIIRELAFELAPKVRVNGVAPGGTITDIRNAIKTGQGFGDDRSFFDIPGIEQFIIQSNPLARLNDVRDHANHFLYLASDESANLTGVIIHSDGGYGIRGGDKVRGGEM